MEDCVFCKIVKGEIPSYKVYEDDDVFAFLDIHPINTGHTLVIPKQHVPEFQDLNEKTYGAVMSATQKISRIAKEKFNPKRVGIMIVGWDVPHTHVHVVPMNEHGDITSKTLLENRAGNPSQEELTQTAQLLALQA